MKYHELPTYDDNESKIRTYRKFALIDEDYEITEDNIDDYALGLTCAYTSEPRSKVRNILLRRE